MTAVFRVPRQPNQLAESPNLGRWFLPSCLYFRHIIALTTTPVTNVRSAPSKIFAKKPVQLDPSIPDACPAFFQP